MITINYESYKEILKQNEELKKQNKNLKKKLLSIYVQNYENNEQNLFKQEQPEQKMSIREQNYENLMSEIIDIVVYI